MSPSSFTRVAVHAVQAASIGALQLAHQPAAATVDWWAVRAAIRPADLRPLRSPELPVEWSRVADLLPPLLRWIAGYEQWVLTVRGPDYRSLSVRACPRMIVRRPIPAARVVDTWNDLADQCDVVLRHLAGRESARGATV